MSYSGTVRCSWCGKKGHNRATCPDRKKYTHENPDGYEARRDAEKSRRAQNRKCTYCKESGHNRRKCPQLKADRNTLQRRLKTQREEVKNSLYELGLGVGALVSIPEGYWDESQAVGLVNKIDWKDADHKESVTIFIDKLGGGPNSTYQRTVDLTKENDGSYKTYNCVDVMSPISGELVLSMVPTAWELGWEYKEEKYFPKGERRRYWEWEERL